MSHQMRSLLKTLRSVLIAGVIAILPATAPPALGQSSLNGVAANVRIVGIGMVSTLGNMVFIEIANGTKENNPSCSTSGPGTWSFVLPLTTTIQQQMFALLLKARESYDPVTLVGNGLCDTYDTVETLTNVIY